MLFGAVLYLALPLLASDPIRSLAMGPAVALVAGLIGWRIARRFASAAANDNHPRLAPLPARG